MSGDPIRDFGRYRIGSELGRGGMGVVYRATDTVLRREVALKVLRPDVHAATRGAESLLDEARAAAAIAHPNAVAVYDVGEVDGIAYIAMELVEGRTLRVYVGDASISAETRERWLADVACALSAAHARGVVHRDVKPENILVCPDGIIKVFDFGIARRVTPQRREIEAPAALTFGPRVGTPAYMAPEQIRGEPVDAAADQFAWGLVAYELLTGKRPWGSRDTGLRALREISWRDPAHVSDVNPGVSRPFGDVVMRALSRERGSRFRSMGDLLAEFARVGSPAVPAQARAVEARAGALSTPPPAGDRGSATTESSLSLGWAYLRRADAPMLDVPLGHLPERIGGKYLPVRRLARGRASAVFEVEHEHTGEHLALKLLSRTSALDVTTVRRFRREARMFARVRNEHIVRIVDADVAGELDETPFLVMELLEGETLERLTEGRGSPPAVVLDWMRQVAAGLEGLHAIGIVHRDLKPGNLFLARATSGSAAIKILDFGLSRVPGAPDENTTAEGLVVGTPLYLPPEQASADPTKVGPASDVWSLGMTTYRLLTGRPYWTGTDVVTVLKSVLLGPMDAPSNRGLRLGDDFDRWFLCSCAREPHRRFASVREQMTALTHALRFQEAVTTTGDPAGTIGDSLATIAIGLPVSSAVRGSTQPARNQAVSRRRRAFVFAATMVTIGVLGGVGWWRTAPGPPSSRTSLNPSAQESMGTWDSSENVISEFRSDPAIQSLESTMPSAHETVLPRVPPFESRATPLKPQAAVTATASTHSITTGAVAAHRAVVVANGGAPPSAASLPLLDPYADPH